MTSWNPTAHQPLTVWRSEAVGDPESDLLEGIRLLERVRDGESGPTLRLYRPEPTVAFGQRDIRLPGYGQATASARRLGFAPVVRKAGGRAAAYHQGTLIVDHVEPAGEAMLGHQDRFRILGELYARALGDLGIEAEVGEIPGEYCPGEFSVHGRPGPGSRTTSPVKLVGTAQRVVSGAWLFASVFVVEDSAPLRAVLESVYADMGLDFDPTTAGAAEDLVPGTTVEAVEQALLQAYARHTTVVDPQQPLVG
ncbi:MAG: lipoate--protein ligase family protein [Arthrobacter sp.]|uniref:lipoate--protein ligase family protein n=1 Tax=unclassified Arthrobacter TaxID=235627 RepID=UPI002652B7D3|nr:lipoate--protein ligase family protein [Micrococcaceae bacterium]MDN5879722.1 lipoate--protein ligase family protein [Micrococcaceae bacterium]MDN5886267.1 lipoate--protein ligase family protein [Micrococcaceae bacterium]MDN5906265.1 lipoate--protein ligase family protein [Micrococcaceae bacterium]MDN6300555.1 lipoate--protein ligase family protein [Micrococcaceae bacterium]